MSLGPRTAWTELAPLARRCVDLDPDAVVRLRGAEGTLSLFAWLPFDVLVARTIAVPEPETAELSGFDRAVAAREWLDWLDDEHRAEPGGREQDWRRGLPPVAGWQRLDVVPDAVVRELVRAGALALKEAAAREGVPGAQPRADVAAALLDAVVLTVEADGDSHVDRDGGGNVDYRGDDRRRAELTLRTLSAATRMGFVPRGSTLGVDVSGRWTRLAAGYGSVFAERRGLTLVSGPSRSHA